MRDRITHLGILSVALKRQTDTFRHLLVPRQPETLSELGARLLAQQRDWWRREVTPLKDGVIRILSRFGVRRH